MKTFKSKFGYEVIIFMSILFGMIIGIMVYQKEALGSILSVSAVFSLVYIFLLYLNFSTSYTITDTGILKVKCGFLINKWYNIDKIRAISKTSNLISSPAPSLDRIDLTYGRSEHIIISPKDKAAFAREILKNNPYIKNKLADKNHPITQ